MYFLAVAGGIATRGDCTRRQVGAVLVDQQNRIVSTGYNGAPPGKKGCLSDGACPRGRHYKKVEPHVGLCACGNTWPCDRAVPPSSSYDTGPGACIALHAEQNCLLYSFRDVAGMTMYVSEDPCDGCMKLLKGARVRRVVTPSYDLILDLSSTV